VSLKKLTERIDVLEAKFQSLAEGALMPDPLWWQRPGAFVNDPCYDRIVELGDTLRAAERSQREPKTGTLRARS
jgi:hypothetical protein